MMGLDNPIHLLFLLILLLLVFGAKRLPEMGRSLGTGMRGFKESLSGETGNPAELGRPAQDATAAHRARSARRLQREWSRASSRGTPWPSQSAGSDTRIASASSIISRSCARG